MYQLITKEIPLGDGRTITIESGKLAKQADGSVVVRLGKTMLLATVVYAKEAKEDVDFMPLSVEYKEKFAAMGRFPGGFMKREARPSDYEILIARLVDRALRPLFPDDFHAETFVTIQLMSAEKEVMPDQLAGLAASAALAVSDIPFNGPISEVRVCRINGEFVVNPPTSLIANADLDMIVGATMNDIMMVEGEMKEVPEEVMLEAISVAHAAIKIQCQAQLELMEMAGKTEKRAYSHEVNDPALKQLVHDRTYSLAYAAAMKQNPNKHERSEAFAQIVKDFIETYKAEQPEGAEINEKLIKRYYHDVEKEAVRNMVLDEGVRLDGRKTDEIRPIWCEVDYLPAAHGSAVFTRGETQSLTTVTLGTKLDEKIIDEVMNQGTDRFLLHYNFPPFSTGEAKPARGTSRREVGHGNLAHRALKKMIPSDAAINPYAIRIVSDILESNGSSSMATVCAGTLALLDSGIRMIRPVSGIAMGLISRKDGKFAVLSDILGDEDHLGDMDFKVTGTEKGVTATQMDIKLDGLSYEILSKALNQAKKGREHILKVMMETMPEARADYKDFVPRIHRIVIPKELIGAVIGPGGKIIQEIQAQSGSIITIEEVNDTGVVEIAASSPDSIKAALRRINAIVAVPEVDKVYTGIVKSIVAFGAFVEIMPGKEGLLHISEISWNRLKTVDEELKEGQEIDVKLIEIDKKTNKFKLSRKVLLERPKKEKDPKADE